MVLTTPLKSPALSGLSFPAGRVMPVWLLAVPSWVGSDVTQGSLLLHVGRRGVLWVQSPACPGLCPRVSSGSSRLQPCHGDTQHPRDSLGSPRQHLCLLVPLLPCSPVRRGAFRKVNLSLQVKSRVPSPWLWLCAARSSPRPHRQRAERLARGCIAGHCFLPRRHVWLSQCCWLGTASV